MITKFDKANLQKIRADLNAVLAKYGIDQNLELTIGNIKFSDAEFKTQLSVKVVGAKTMANKILEEEVRFLGLKMEGLGGRKLVDYKARNYAYPFIYEQNGKRFKCSAESAKIYFSI